jgi:hypothetical protein
MNKIQTIISLFVFLVVLFSMDMMFGNPIRETFSNPKNNNIGWDLNYKVPIQQNTLNGNMIYSGKGFLADTNTANYPEGDDQPLFFGFSLS